MKTIKGLTLTELILTLVLSAVLLFGAIQLIVSHTKFTTTLQTGISLSQEAVVVVEHIVANVRNSQYVTIGANSLNLYNVSTTVPIGTYTWSGSDLNYTPQGQAASLVSNKIDQDNPPLFSDPFTPSNTQTKVLHMAVNTKDSRFPNIGPKSSTTTVYCRIPGPPVRLWGLNLAGTMGVKGYFSNIQDAINSTDCADGDTVQIGFNGRAPYKENVTNLVGSTYKNISLQGSFDDYGQQHLRDPAFETIIQGVQTYLGQPSAPTVTFEIQTPLVQSVSIRGFTIINGEDGIRVWTDSADMSGHVLDVCDNIVKQNGRTDSFCAGIDSASGHIVIRNNTVTANQGVGITSADGNIVANNSVTSNLGSNDGGGINVGTSGIAGLSGCVVSNNTIQYNQALHGGGVFAHAGGGVLTITNNNISYNTASSGLPLVTGGGGIFAKSTSLDGSSFVTIINNTISNNHLGVKGTYGAGIYYELHSGWGNGSILSCIERNTISLNDVSATATGTGNCKGGGIYFQTSLGAARPGGIRQNLITDNKVKEGNGMYLSNSEAPISDSVGRIYAGNNIIKGSKSANTADGGGIYARCGFDPGSLISVINNVIADNAVSGKGGGIYVYKDYGIPAAPCGYVYICTSILDLNTASGGGANIFTYDTTKTERKPWVYSSYITAATAVYNVDATNFPNASGSPGPNFVNRTEYKLNTGSSCIDRSLLATDTVYLNYDGQDFSYTRDTNIPPSLSTSRTDAGAYGGADAVTTVGFVMPTQNDDNTPFIVENVIGIAPLT